MGKKILVVDDEQDLLMMVETRLSANGYEVVTAENGLQGLEKVSQAKPDLIISDVLMPEMDGFAFYKELKNKEETKSIPVLILTARGKMRDTFMTIGVDDFLAKPFQPEELLGKVSALLSLSAAEVTQAQESASVSKDNQSEKPAEKREEKPVAPSASEIFKILIVASTPEIAQRVTKQLSEKNCEIQSVTKGGEASAKAQEISPNLILMEVHLDDQPAKNAIAKIRRVMALKKTPIALFSYLDKTQNNGESIHQKQIQIDGERKTALDAGGTEFLGCLNEVSFAKGLRKYLP